MKEHGIAAFVRQTRLERGMTQAVLADSAGISRARVAQIEAGSVNLPNADHRRRLARALGVSHLELLAATGEITPEEAGLAAADGTPEPVDELKRSLLHAVNNVDWREPDAAAVGKSVMRSMLGVRHDQEQAIGQRGVAGSGRPSSERR